MNFFLKKQLMKASVVFFFFSFLFLTFGNWHGVRAVGTLQIIAQGAMPKTDVSTSFNPQSSLTYIHSNTTFSLSVNTDDPLGVTWTTSGPWGVSDNGGTIDNPSSTSTVQYTAPAFPHPGLYRIKVTSLSDPSQSDYVDFCAPSILDPNITISEPDPSVPNFTASTGDACGVVWSLQEAGAGSATVSGGVAYFTFNQSGSYHIIASNAGGPTYAHATFNYPHYSASMSSDLSSTFVWGGDSETFPILTNDPLGINCTLSSDSVGTITTTQVSPGEYSCVYQSPQTQNSAYRDIGSVIGNTNSDTLAGFMIYFNHLRLQVTGPTDVSPGSNFTYTADTNDDQGVTWSVVEPNGGTIASTTNTSAVYTAPIKSGTYHVRAVTIRNTVEDPRITSDLAVTVSPPTVQMATSTFHMAAKDFITLNATTNDPLGVIWSIDSIGGGDVKPITYQSTCSSSNCSAALYTAPSSQGTYTVRATSVSDATAFATSSIIVDSPASITITPSSATMIVNHSLSFFANSSYPNDTFTFFSDTAYNPNFNLLNNYPLSCVVSFDYGCQLGGFDSSGQSTNSTSSVLTAPSSPGTFYVRVASKNGHGEASALITVVPSPIGISISPNNATISSNSTLKFYASVTGDDKGVVWSVNNPVDGVTLGGSGASAGTISQNGLYQASGYTGQYRVVATSVTDPTQSAWVTVNVTGGSTFIQGGGFGSNSISISPASTLVKVGGQVVFTVEGNYHPINLSVKEGSAGGTISLSTTSPISWLYTAPSIPGVYHIIASNAFESASTVVTVIGSGDVNQDKEVKVSISPSIADITSKETEQFTATVTNASTTDVIWSVVESDGGKIVDGLYTPPNTFSSTTNTYHVFAKSIADPTKTALATVIVEADTTALNTAALPEDVKDVSEGVVTSENNIGSSTSTTTTATQLNVVASIVGQVTEQVAQKTQIAIVTVGKFAGGVRDLTFSAVKSPVGSTVTNYFAAVGIVSGFSGWTTVSLLGSPISASEVFLVPLRLWGILLSALGIRRRNRPWGTVYDSVTKMPIDPAVVILYNEAGKKITTCITDLEGRYGFFVPKGTYYMVVHKVHYVFPSAKLADRSEDEVYSGLYFGGKIEVTEDGSVIHQNIPMDSKGFDWNEFMKNKMRLSKLHPSAERTRNKIEEFIFWLGYAIGLVSVFVIPHVYSITILSIYVFLIILRYSGVSGKIFGTITDNKGQQLSFAVISVFSKTLNQELFKKVADQYGRYYALVPKGEYEIRVSRKNSDESYTEVYKKDVEAKNGVINWAIKV